MSEEAGYLDIKMKKGLDLAVLNKLTTVSEYGWEKKTRDVRESSRASDSFCTVSLFLILYIMPYFVHISYLKLNFHWIIQLPHYSKFRNKSPWSSQALWTISSNWFYFLDDGRNNPLLTRALFLPGRSSGGLHFINRSVSRGQPHLRLAVDDEPSWSLVGFFYSHCINL